MKHKIYIFVMTLVALGVFACLNFLPRSTVSELERRELKTFPVFTFDSLKSGDFTTAVSSWYSDTEPYRDYLMALSMDVRQARAFYLSAPEEQIAFIAGDEVGDPEMDMDPEMAMDFYDEDTTMTAEGDSVPAAIPIGGSEDNGKITNNGILIVGAAPEARALMMYQGRMGGESYARVVNTYQEKFPDVNIYCMIVPTAVEFYCPEKAKSRVQSEEATIENLYANLLPEVKPVRLIPVLQPHVGEHIYLRTDHHWAPLGAYYAARELCATAGVHVPDLADFDENITRRFVGSMYGFTQDASIKNSPEDFVFYIPNNVTYTTTYIQYTINAEYRVTAESKPYQGEFFFHYRDGSGAAYCSFMGGDSKITRVVTSVKNGRRVLILKDSFGNALPGYLFGSFEEVHVVDGRYFTKNMVAYVSQYGITDIVFANNVFKAFQGGRQYISFLTQSGKIEYVPRPVQDTVPAQDSASLVVAAPSVSPSVAPAVPATDSLVAPLDTTRIP